MLDSLDHAIILVRDLDAASRTYAALLGRRFSWRGEHPSLGTANVLYRLDNTYLELLSPLAEGGLAEGLRGRLEETGEGLLAILLLQRAGRRSLPAAEFIRGQRDLLGRRLGS